VIFEGDFIGSNFGGRGGYHRDEHVQLAGDFPLGDYGDWKRWRMKLPRRARECGRRAAGPSDGGTTGADLAWGRRKPLGRRDEDDVDFDGCE